MGCCGGSGRPSRTIRPQKIERPQHIKPNRVPTQRLSKYNVGAEQARTPPLPVRQRLVQTERCSQCGHTTVMVNIAGREREQCSNPSCRKIKR